MMESDIPLASCFQHYLCADDVGLDEDEGVDDRSVDVGLGSKMNDEIATVNGFFGYLGVGNVTFDEGVVGVCVVGVITSTLVFLSGCAAGGVVACVPVVVGVVLPHSATTKITDFVSLSSSSL